LLLLPAKWVMDSVRGGEQEINGIP